MDNKLDNKLDNKEVKISNSFVKNVTIDLGPKVMYDESWNRIWEELRDKSRDKS